MVSGPAWLRLRFDFTADEPLLIPGFSGSAWRGLLGHALKRSACVTGAAHCKGCLLASSCAYPVLFEPTPRTAPDAWHARRYQHLPPPMVLGIDPTWNGALPPRPAPARHLSTGDSFRLDIALIGPACERVPHLIHALIIAGELGIGRDHGRFRLAEVAMETEPGNQTWQTIYRPGAPLQQVQLVSPQPLPMQSDALEISLTTPTRLKRHGHLLGPEDLDAETLLLTLASRLGLLAEHYGGDPADFAWSRLAPATQTLTLEYSELAWQDWSRYSSRQRSRMQLGGLVGALRLSGPGLTELWPLLWLGQFVHIGKNTSFGLGAYRLTMA